MKQAVMLRASDPRNNLRNNCRSAALMAALIAFALACSMGNAQTTTAAIFGTVTDPTGAAIAGASVTVTNVLTGIEHHATSDRQGAYHVTQLPPGSYRLTISSHGFSTKTTLPFTLLVNQQSEQNVSLAIGKAVTQSISVTATSLLINTQNSGSNQVIGTHQIESLPLNGRDYMQLAQLSPGVTPIVPGMSSPASQWTGTSTVAVSIAGLREDDVSYLYDGIETRNAWYGAEGLLPSVDNIQEFNILQSGAPATFSGGGAFVSVVTRSGTNHLHGSVYEFLRNNDFDARNYFDVGAAPPFHQNQFGARLGGPIRKNKMFFFLNYEGFRQEQPTSEFALVPTPQQIAGNFSANPKQLVNPYTGAPFPGNRIPSQFFNPIGQKILSFYPAPNGSYSGGTNYAYLSNISDGWDQESVRIDDTLSDKDTIFGRFTNQTQTTTISDITPFRTIVFPSNPKNLAVGWTHIFSSDMVNNVRFGWTHTATGEQRADGYNKANANPLGLINEADQPGSYGPPSFGVTGYANPGSTEGTDIIREGLVMGTESLMMQKGRNQITAGLDIRYEPIYMYEDWAATSINFNGVYTGDPIGDLLMGIPVSSFTAIGDPLLNLHMWYQAYYVQDKLKVNSRLTLNAGLNYQHQTQPVDARNHVGSFDVANNEDLSYPDTNRLGLTRAMVKPRYIHFAPRLGFNYVPFKNGGTDVKGGFGIYYLQPNINQYEVMVDTTKYYLIQSYNNSPHGRPSFTLNELFGPSVPGAGPTASFIQPDGKTPYTYEWNLTVDRTLGNWLLEASYLGSAAHHYEERPNIAPLKTDGTTRLPGWNGVQENTMSGSSFYNGLAVRVEHRFSSGFSLLGAYTFSKCLGWPWQDVFSWHPLNMRLDRGHCQEDLNHNLVANSIYELPFGKGRAFLNDGGLTNALVGGWRLAAIVSLHSGPWATLGSNQNLGIFVNALPNVTGPVNNSSLHSGLGKHGKLGPYFNTQNVVPVKTLGVQGNAAVQEVSTPGAATWDLSGYKGWTFAERYTLDFRADAFNVFNRVNFHGLDTGVNDSRFGLVTGAGPAREIQLSMRFSF